MRPLYFWLLVAALCLLLPKFSPYILFAGFALGPGCCCGGSTCTIFSDNFASDDIATNWTTSSSGSWSISSSTLSTSSTSARLIATAAHPANTGAMKVEVDIKGGSSDKAKIFAAWVDSSHYVYGLITFGASGSLIIVQNSGSGETTLKSRTGLNFTTGVYKTFSLCIAPQLDFVVLTGIDNSGITQRTSVNLVIPSNAQYFGVGTGTSASAIGFQNFSASRTDNSCPTCPPGTAVTDCSHCIGSGGNRPAALLATINGVTAGSSGDGCCAAQWNAQFVMTVRESGSGDDCTADTSLGQCGYCIILNAPTCNVTGVSTGGVSSCIILYIQASATPGMIDYVIRCGVYSGGLAPPGVNFGASQLAVTADPEDCFSLAINLNSGDLSQGSFSSTYCNGTAATMTIAQI